MKFCLTLDADCWDKPLQIKIDVNNNVMWNGEIKDNKIVEFDQLIPDNSKVELNITLYNKTMDQTIVENGKIVKDSLLRIKKITVDEIDIESLIWEAIYTPENSPPQKNTTNLGQNGIWCLKFETPLYLWFLENTSWYNKSE
jgi:hypothetical protein